MITNQKEVLHINENQDFPKTHVDRHKLHEASLRHTALKILQNEKYVKILDHYPNAITFQFIELEKIKDVCHQLGRYHSLYKWQSIQTLRIWFHKNHYMSDGALKWMTRLLKQNFTNLTKFKLFFVDCFEITDNGMETLSQIARHLPKLKQLTIDCYCTQRITGAGLKRIGYELSRYLNHLESLSLCCDELYHLKDFDIDTLLLSMGKYFDKLKDLELNFSNCELITNEGIESVARQISKNFKGLQKFHLCLIGCESINYDSLEQVSDILSFIPQFKLTTKSSW